MDENNNDVSGPAGTKKDNTSIPDRGRLFIISAPSGTGKTTLCNAVRKRFPNLEYSISYTTRSPRKGETDGEDYHFISTAEFLNRIASSAWAEWAEVHGNYYGTSADDLNSWISAGKDVLLDIDVAGAMQIRKKYPGCISIFILPPSLSVLEERLCSRRTDSPENIAIRLENAKKEIAARDQYDHIIVNNELSSAIDELESLIRSAPSGRVPDAWT
ncbi:MAG: guanylate kinase [Deltaproteobacteria bacterium]|nr:guanylate kinase [Deltaproteobacteria bacterium]